MMPAPRLDVLRLPQAQHVEQPWLLVPVGSTEQHGPHLPFGTDTVIARCVTARVGARLRDAGEQVIVAPAIEFGASGEHEDFCGTVSIGTEALQTVLLELGRSATRWARGVVFVNGHGGNVTALTAAVERLRYEGRAVAWVPAAPTRGDAHAGRTETSLMLALHPEQVSLADAVAGPTASLQELLPRLRAGGVAAVSPNGVLGDPRGASASEGARLLDQVVADVVGRLRHVHVNERGMLCATEVSV